MNMTLIITGGMLGVPKITAFDFPADWHKIEAEPGKSRSPSW
jgi:hypothetical protein